MRFTPAFMVLEEFDAAAEGGNALAWAKDEEPQKPAAKSVNVLTEADLQRSHDNGYEAGYQAATAQFEVVLSQRDEETRIQLAAAELEFAERCGARLVEDLTQAIDRIREDLARDAARSVLPFIDTQMRALAVDDLAESIMAMNQDTRDVHLRVTGPAALIGALQQRLPERWQLTATADESDPELTVQVDTSLFRTQIGNWVKRVEEASA